MKKMVFIAGALMLVIAGSAMAAGTDLGWNDCVAGGGTQDRSVTCTNTGTGVMYLSFQVDASLPMLAATAGLIDVVTPNQIVAGTSWWQPATFGARWGTGNATGLSGACPEWWAAAPNGPIVFAPTAVNPNPAPNRMRIHLDAIVGSGEEQVVDPGVDYFSGSLSLKFNAGTLSNAECTAGGAIGTYDLNLQQPGGVPDTHLGQTPVVRDCVTFRNPATTPCPGATPTQKATWGAIKALYR
jgi:hypothetical protein